MAETQSKSLTFKELEAGKKFIAFPQDGDDSGHGGFRRPSYIFTKLRMTSGSEGENCVRDADGTLCKNPDDMKVLPVE